jgi:hypothetical protein
MNGHVVRTGKISLKNRKHRQEDNIKMYISQIKFRVLT